MITLIAKILMNLLYLLYLHVKVWWLRRRLRFIGFIGDTAKAHSDFITHPIRSTDDDIHFLLDVIKIFLGLIGLLSLWIMFFLNHQALDRLHETPHQPISSEQTSLPFL